MLERQTLPCRGDWAESTGRRRLNAELDCYRRRTVLLRLWFFISPYGTMWVQTYHVFTLGIVSRNSSFTIKSTLLNGKRRRSTFFLIWSCITGSMKIKFSSSNWHSRSTVTKSGPHRSRSNFISKEDLRSTTKFFQTSNVIKREISFLDCFC